MAILGFQPQFRLTGQPTWINAGAQLPATATSFTFTGLQTATEYDTQVLEISSAGTAASNIISVFTASGETPGGTTVANTTTIINASQTPGTAAPGNGPFNTFQLTGTGGTGTWQILRNGALDPTSSSVLELYYGTNHTTYQESLNGNSFGTPGWWQDTGTGWLACASPIGTTGGTTTFDDEFTSAIWLTHATWQSGDLWSFVGTSFPSGTSQGPTWWSNPVDTPSAAAVYSDSGGFMNLSLIKNPGGNGISNTTLGALMNNQLGPGGLVQLFGYFEFSVSVPAVPGFLFQFDFEDQPATSSTGTVEIDVVIWTDSGGVGHVSFVQAITSAVIFTTTLVVSNQNIYGVNWQSDFITCYLNGAQVGQIPNPGGDWLTKGCFCYFLTSDATYFGFGPAFTAATATAKIDYLRIYQTKPTITGEALAWNAIGTQTVGVAFAATGSISGVSATPTLNYKINSGAFTALPAGSSVTQTSFSVAQPAQAQGSYTLTIEDTAHPSITAVSNTYQVNPVASGAPGTPIGLNATSETSASISVGWSPPTTGGALDHGFYQLQYWIGSASPTTGPKISYATNGSGSFTDSTGIVWTIVGGVIEYNGTADTSTSNVVQILLLPGSPQVAWQLNNAGNWYSQNIPASAFNWNGPVTTSPLASPGIQISPLAASQAYNIQVFAANSVGAGTVDGPISASTTAAPGPSTNFTISGGKVIAPNGSTWICRGVDNYFIDSNGSGNVADHATIGSVFPGINTFKACLLAQHTYSDCLPFITDWTTNHGCVIVIANYMYGAQYQISSSRFAADAATFSNIARGAIGNPFVWFESENEAQNGGAPGSGQTVDDEHRNHYNAIRSLVQFTGTAVGTNLQVTGISGQIVIGMTINPTAGVPLHTTIVSQIAGTAGGNGSYTTSNPTTVSSATLTAGNGNIIVFCSVAGNPFFPASSPSAQGTASYYSNMYNIIWDDHWYGTGNGVQSTGSGDTLNAFGGDQWNTGLNSVANRIAGFNNFATSLDGQIPVGTFEWGDASAGANGPHDYGATNQQIAATKAVCNACVGNGHAGFAGMTAWEYGNYGTFGGDVLQNGNSIFQQADNYGVIVAFCIANPNSVNTNNYGFTGGPS